MHKIKRRERPFATINSKTRVLRNKTNIYVCLCFLLSPLLTLCLLSKCKCGALIILLKQQ